MEDYAKISRAGLRWGTVEHKIGKRSFSLPNIFFLVTKLQLDILEAENKAMKYIICELYAELSEANNMLSDNQTLVHLGTHLSKLKLINQRSTSLASDQFYGMHQGVMPKLSPEDISLGGGLIVDGLLASLGINYNTILYGITNGIPSPSSLQYVIKKSREATFMIVAVFVCKHLCII